jgi:hypothetical protein
MRSVEKDETGNGEDMAAALTQSRQVKAEAEQLVETLQHARVEWEALLRQEMKHRPYTTLALAAGVGYVIGGGLAPGVVRSLVGTGSRLAIGVLLQRLLATPALDSTDAGTE